MAETKDKKGNKVKFIRKNGKVIPIKDDGAGKDNKKRGANGLKKAAIRGAKKDIRTYSRHEKQSKFVKKAGLGISALGAISSFVGRSSLKNRNLGKRGSSLRSSARGAARKGLTKARFGKKALIAGGIFFAAGLISEKLSKSNKNFAKQDKKTLKRKGKFSSEQGRAVDRRVP